MKQVFRIDENGFYKEPVIIGTDEQIPTDCVETIPPNFYKAQYVNGEWVEALSQADIDAIKNAPQPLSELEQLKKQQADLVFQLMMNGVL
jgi:hypothetical protein